MSENYNPISFEQFIDKGDFEEGFRWLKSEFDRIDKAAEKLRNTRLKGGTGTTGKDADDAHVAAEQAKKDAIDLVKLSQEKIKLEKQELQLQDLKDKQAKKNDYRLKAEETSIKGMGQKLSALRKEYDLLTDSERENAEIGGKLLKQIQQLDVEYKKLKQSTGRYQDSVGNYSMIVEKLTAKLEGLKLKEKQIVAETKRSSIGFKQASGEQAGFTAKITGTVSAMARQVVGFGKTNHALNEVRSEIKHTTKELDKLNAGEGGQGGLKQTASAFQNVWFKAIAVGFAIKTVFSGLKNSVEAYKQQAIATKQLETALGGSSSALQLQASEMQRLKGVGDETVLAMQKFMATQKLNESQIRQATPAIIDFAEGLGIDLNTAVKAVTSGINGSVIGLSRYGIKVDASMSKTEKFETIIKQINERFSGQAEAANEATAGFTRLSNAMSDFSENSGGLFAVAFDKPLGFIGSKIDILNSQFARLFENIKNGSMTSGDALKLMFGGMGAVDVSQRLATNNLLMEEAVKITDIFEKKNIELNQKSYEATLKVFEASKLRKEMIDQTYQSLVTANPEMALAGKTEELWGMAVKRTNDAFKDAIKLRFDEVNKLKEANKLKQQLAATAADEAKAAAIEKARKEKQIADEKILLALKEMLRDVTEDELEVEVYGDEHFRKSAKAKQDQIDQLKAMASAWGIASDEAQKYIDSLAAADTASQIHTKQMDDAMRNMTESYQNYTDATKDIFAVYDTYQSNEADKRLKEFEARKKKELEVYGLTEDQKLAIEKRYDAESEKIMKDEFERQKKLRILEINLNGAAAGIAVWADGEPWQANLAQSIAIGVQTAAALAIAQQQQFEQGGIASDKFLKISGNRHGQGGENLLKHVNVESGEIAAIHNRSASAKFEKEIKMTTDLFNAGINPLELSGLNLFQYNFNEGLLNKQTDYLSEIAGSSKYTTDLLQRIKLFESGRYIDMSGNIVSWKTDA